MKCKTTTKGKAKFTLTLDENAQNSSQTTGELNVWSLVEKRKSFIRPNLPRSCSFPREALIHEASYLLCF